MPALTSTPFQECGRVEVLGSEKSTIQRRRPIRVRDITLTVCDVAECAAFYRGRSAPTRCGSQTITVTSMVLDGMTALVTGGSRGIGRAIVERLVRDGASVVFSFARQQSAADEVVAATAGRAEAVAADLSDSTAARALYDSAEAALGGLDILVNNAGSGTVPKPISVTTDEEYDQLMLVNTRAVFVLMREASQRLRNDGRIVNISTLNTVVPDPAVAVHAASKAAIEQLAACSARELGSRGITVNSVSPGATDTDLLRGNNPGIDVEAAVAHVASMTPLGRLGRPDDIADVVGFLVGPDGRWITGQNLRAGGGLGG